MKLQIPGQVGDVITCTSRPEGGWWKGILRGREGVFPDNFVKVRNRQFGFQEQADVFNFVGIHFSVSIYGAVREISIRK